MSGRDLRLAPVAAGASIGALTSVFVPVVAPWLAGGSMLVVMALFVSRRGRTGIGPLIALAGEALAATSLAVVFAVPARDAAAAWDGRIIEIRAEIASSSTVGSDGRLWFDAQTTALGGPGAVAPVDVPVRIGIDPLDGAEFGAGIRVTGQAMATDASERAALVIFATTAEVERPADGIFAVAAGIRTSFVERAMRLPEPGAGLLPGLAVGDTRAVDAALSADMLTSGLSHLTAVSGANCAIVVGATFWLTALCGGSRLVRAVLALLTLAGFVVLVTPEPSVVRASVMAGLAMLTVMLGRPSAGAGVLCLAVVVILVADPWLAATPGFALSVAATAALILLAPPLARGLERWMPLPLALAIAVPVSAQLTCGPIIALFAEQQALVGVAANLLAAPAAPLVTVIGLLACLASAVPGLAELLTAAAWLPAAWIATTAIVSAGLPGAQILVVPGLGTALIVAVLSAAVAVLLWRTRSGALPRLVLLRGSALLLTAAVALGGARMLLDGPLAEQTAPEGWSIAACDVGQGDAVLVRSASSIALIDTGPEPEPLRRCLASLGVDAIDLLVLSHFDLDHVGGAAAVVGRSTTVLHGPVAEAEDERLLAEFEASGATLVEAASGQRGGIGQAQWRVLWPRAEQSAFAPGNDTSVVWEVEGGGVPKTLFLGDLSASPQRMVAASGALSPGYDVVKVAHHGSADQDAGLYEQTHAAAAIVSVGAENDYGHPRTDTLDLLSAVGATILRTDAQGRVLLGLRAGELAVWAEYAPDRGG